MITAEQAIYDLYKQVQGTEYKSSVHWTNTKTFTPAYEKINTEFVLDTTLASPAGIEPTFVG